jgi:hypothetical protein
MKLLLDENVDNRILNGIIRRNPEIDCLRVQDVPEIYKKDDRTVLDWAAHNDRVLLTHDIRTMKPLAIERATAGLPMPGVLQVSRRAPMSQIIDDILTLVGATFEGELNGQVWHVPL